MKRLWTIAFLISIITILLITFFYFLPLLDGIVMGIVFAYVAKPIKKRIENIGRIKSSLISTLFVMLPVSLLLFYGIFQGLTQAVYIFTHYNEFEEKMMELIRQLGVDGGEEYLKGILKSIFSIVQSTFKLSAVEITKKFTLFILNFFISAVVCFYVLADLNSFVERTTTIIPEERRGEFKRFIKEVDETFVSLWFGNFLVALLIGLASLPYFICFGVPFPPLLSGLMFLAALIPIFAEWMVIVPVSLYLLLLDIGRGLTFLAIGVVFYYIVPELILRPHFLSYRTKIHPLILMLAFIGGGIIGGVSGFFLAPMFAGLATALYNYYTGERNSISQGSSS